VTLGELIAVLRELDPEALVVLSEDEEGNGFGPLDDVSGPGWWDQGNREYFDVDEECRDEDDDCHCQDHDTGDAVAAVCLWP
jgi:hypothetical protein